MLTPPDCHSFELDIENYVPVFHATEAASSPSAVAPAESGGGSPLAGSSDDEPVTPIEDQLSPEPQPHTHSEDVDVSGVSKSESPEHTASPHNTEA